MVVEVETGVQRDEWMVGENVDMQVRSYTCSRKLTVKEQVRR